MGRRCESSFSLLIVTNLTGVLQKIAVPAPTSCSSSHSFPERRRTRAFCAKTAIGVAFAEWAGSHSFDLTLAGLELITRTMEVSCAT